MAQDGGLIAAGTDGERGCVEVWALLAEKLKVCLGGFRTLKADYEG